MEEKCWQYILLDSLRFLLMAIYFLFKLKTEEKRVMVLQAKPRMIGIEASERPAGEERGSTAATRSTTAAPSSASEGGH
jgi:hypothetical protein